MPFLNFKYWRSYHQLGLFLKLIGPALQVEVAFSGLDGKEDVKSESASTSLKVLPPWMIKQGMNLTKEQRGEVKQESNTDGSSAQPDFSDDRKSTVENDDKKNLQVCTMRWIIPSFFLSMPSSSLIHFSSVLPCLKVFNLLEFDVVFAFLLY